MFIIVLILITQKLFCVDFHDFDCYQYQFTADEIDFKIRTYLEKDQEIKKFYLLTPHAFYIGDLENQKIDYVLNLNTHPSSCLKCIKINELRNKRIAIDPGHFGGRFGELEQRYIAIPAEKTKNGQPIRLQEGDLTYLTALELQRLLEAEGALVFITRSEIGQGAIEMDFFEWLEAHLELKESGLTSSKIFRNHYNKEDLRRRAKKINTFAPDITIAIHYNVHWTKEEIEEKALLTQSNFSLMFVPGAFTRDELNEVEDRYEFLRLIVTRDLEQSLNLSEHIGIQFANHLEVPLLVDDEKTSYSLFQKPGICCRNLALTRLVHSPICYAETLVQNNENEIYRLSTYDTLIAGVPCSKRILSAAYAYFKGIKSYFNNYIYINSVI